MSDCKQCGEYQSPDTVGFIFGCVLSGLVMILGSFFLWRYGGQNDVHCHGKSVKAQYNPFILIWRLIGFGFSIGVLSTMENVWSLSYFTIWNFILLCAYYLSGVLVSIVLVFAVHRLPSLDKDGKVDYIPCKATQKLLFVHQILGEIELPVSLMVTLMVWCYLYPASTEDDKAGWLTFSSISMHAVNFVLMLVDFLVSGWRINKMHFPLPAMWASLYLLWHLIGNQVWGLMCYPIMYTDKPIFIAWGIALLVLIEALFFGYYLISKKKDKMPCFRMELLEDEIPSAKLGDAPSTNAASAKSAADQNPAALV